MLCSVIFSPLLLTCLHLPATSPPSSFQLALVFPSSRICRECTVWQPSSGLGPHWSPKLSSSNATVLSLLSCLSRHRNTAQAELTHTYAVPLRAGSQTSPFSQFDFEVKAATKGTTASHNGPTGILQPLNITPCQESHKPPTFFTRQVMLIWNKNMNPVFSLCKEHWIQLPRGHQ